MFEIIPNWHPIFVHFTVALFSISAGLFTITSFIKSPLKEQWQTVARWNLWFGAGITIITGLAGLYAYNTVAHDTPSHAAMTEHRNWAIVAITLILGLAIWSIIRVHRNLALGTAFVVAMVITGGILAATAWRGGEVVYRYGLGVMSLPKVEGEGHAHEHADGTGHGSADALTPEMTDQHLTQDGVMPEADIEMEHDQSMSSRKPQNHKDDGHAH